MSVTYYAYTTNVSNYDEGNVSYNTFTGMDDDSYRINLTTPFIFNGTPYSTMYLNSNGLINFTQRTTQYQFTDITSQFAGFYIMGTDLYFYQPNTFLRYKEFSDTFVLIYNGHIGGAYLFQVKITLYLANSIRSGDVVADFGNVTNAGNSSQFGISFGTNNQANIIQGINFLDYTFNSPYVFNYPNSPNQVTTGIQSTYANKQFVVSIVRAPPPCFKEGTKILTDKGYISIQDLRKGDMVKTLKHDYKQIDMIGKKEIYHPATQERIKSQLYQCSTDKYPEIFEPLIITGCHSILVENSTTVVNAAQIEQVKEVNGGIYLTDDMLRLPACVDERAAVYEIVGNHTIYHFALENDDCYMNYGIYANGLLVETCSKRYLSELSNMDLIE